MFVYELMARGCCKLYSELECLLYSRFFPMVSLPSRWKVCKQLLEMRGSSWSGIWAAGRDRNGISAESHSSWPGYSSSSGQCSSVLLDGDGEHKMWTGWQLGCCDFLCGRVLIFPRKAELVIVLSGGWESQKNAASIYSSYSFNSVPAT